MDHDGLIDKLKQVPSRPGVYRMLDDRGQVIYVGKARSLRARLRQHVRGEGDRLEPWAQVMREKLADFDYLVTRTETEALILEATLIKQYRPHFNIRLRDDKSYPYLCLTAEKYPRLLVIRDLPQDARVRIPGGGGKYRRGFHDPKRHKVYGLSAGEIFGPYPSADVMWRTRRMICRLFGLRQCRRSLDGTPSGKPCLYYHLGQCIGPCTGDVSEEEYGRIVEQVTRFLDGNTEQVASELRDEMQRAAGELDFERAAAIRDKLKTIERLGEEQLIVANENREQDLVGAAAEGDNAVVKILGVRAGRLCMQETYTLTHISGRSLGQVIEAAMTIHYGAGNPPARHVLLGAPVEDSEEWEMLLADLRGGPVDVSVPQRGERRRLVGLAQINAQSALEALLQSRGGKAESAAALADLAEALQLAAAPSRIECYDISNLQGDHAVGAMVVFTDGLPDKDAYRRFGIRDVAGQDDYAMLAQMVRRRLQAARSGSHKFLPLPDLMVVDGGKGQLSAVAAVVDEHGTQDDIAVVSLAEAQEEVFVRGRAEPLGMGDHPRGHLLLQRLRDEAHRFAISYHRDLRSRQMTTSMLDDVDGIGPHRRAQLLRAFPSVAAMRRASVEELAAVPGMNRKVAQALHQHLVQHVSE
ncbi:MAG: excinuclease ABC subunit UvrC [candidate division WS1 bacterium]|mgnify:CR=1 FL=1|jgi:excinuclease ABC subunit C|nr:excinuclease ABC subunit UvrC [candidate division WS1 bacterium]